MSGYVYFAQRGDQWEYVKIGWSRDYKRRLHGLSLKPLLVVEAANATRLERDLHADYDHSRGPGEWFTWTPEMGTEIGLARQFHDWRRTGRIVYPALPRAETP